MPFAIWGMVLLALIPLQRVEAAQAPAPKAESPRNTPEPTQPTDDPLGRSTPQGTVNGLIEAVQQGNLDRAAEYLDSRLKPADRQELAQQLGVVLNRKLVASLNRLSNTPKATFKMGFGAIAIVSALSKASPAMSMSSSTACSGARTIPSGCSPPTCCRRSRGSLMKSSLRGSNGICRCGCAPFNGCRSHSIDGLASCSSCPWPSVSPRC